MAVASASVADETSTNENAAIATVPQDPNGMASTSPEATEDFATATAAEETVPEATDEMVSTTSRLPQEVAVASQFLTLDNYPVELELLDPDADLSNRNVVTDSMVSQETLTLPSLWWAQDQFGGKLLENWLAYPGSVGNPRRVDIVVDRQLWSLSTYLQRYSFVNHFGTATTEFGYSLRVFNDQGQPLASYLCDFSALDGDDVDALADGTYEFENMECSVSLDSSGAGALRGRTNTFDAFF
jgi:hypothetical protein